MIGCGLKKDDPTPPDPPDVTSTTVPIPGGGGTTTVPAPSCAEAPALAEVALATNCATCHGPTSQKFGGFGDATDAVALVADGWVVPGDSASSQIFVSINDGSMPTSGPITAVEAAQIKTWIDCGAVDWASSGGGGGTTQRGFIEPVMEFTAARNDANLLDFQDDFLPDQPNARYFSLVPLYNAGVPADRIELYARAITKLMWGLTTERQPPKLVPVDLDGLVVDGAPISVAEGLGDKLLFRVDLKDFGWDGDGQAADVWEEMVKAYPFAIKYDDQFDAAQDLSQITKTRIPIVHGDWFAANASLPPLYYDLLDIPDNIDDFYQKFGGINSIQQQFDDNVVDCAGMDGQASLVSQNNRVICRHDSNQGYCWESFDFGSVAGQKDIFSFPTDFVQQRDGGESFCSLGDGQQVYLVYNSAGARLDDAPIAIVSDYNPDSGGEVHDGLSCMRCHELGVITRDDQVLDAVLANENLFDDAVVQQTEEWYPPQADWAGIYGDDIQQFQDAMTEADVPIGEEVTWALSEDYEALLTTARVAAELGLPAAALQGRLDANQAIAVKYASLFAGSQTLTRDQFENAARDTICDLQLGDVCDEQNFCGLSSVPCPDGSFCDQGAGGQCSKLN